MTERPGSPDRNDPADVLNRHCACRFTDVSALDRALGEGADESFVAALHAERPNLFAAQPVFIGENERTVMAEVVRAVERVTALPTYRERALANAPAIARIDHGERGVLFGYDFHLSDDGPKLIEINTNAGGSLLAYGLSRAQVACCESVDHAFAIATDLAGLDERLVSMFRVEHQRARPGEELRHVAIVDEAPDAQFLAPEFALFVRLFEANGVRATVAAPSELVFADGRLRLRDGGDVIDLVYNRLTDFTLAAEPQRPLVEAYTAGVVALTPNPRAHALFADKACLAWLSDAAVLRSMGAEQADVALLGQAIPTTRTLVDDDPETLWRERKGWFFKPRDGFGSRAAYRGDKLTRRVFESIVQAKDRYVAQRLVPPRERIVQHGDGAGDAILLKFDLRNYVFDGDVLLVAARLYDGQTTNFRTERGGFAAVYAPRI